MRHKILFTIAIAAALLTGACSEAQGTNGSSEVTTMPYGWTPTTTINESETPVPEATSTPATKSTATPTAVKKATATPTPTKKTTATPTPTKKATATPTLTPVKTDSVTPEWRDMLKEMGTGWNLGNTMDAYDCTWLSDEMTYETAWVGAPKVSQKMIDTVAEAGFKTIRIPVSWHNHVTKTTKTDGTVYYKISEKWMKRIHEIVDYCINDDLFVILNIHHDDAGAYFVYPDAAHEKSSLEYVTSIWEQIAAEFGDYDYHLIFETLNEPRLVGANEWNASSGDAQKAMTYINSYNQAAVNTIRNTAGLYNNERYIGCPGYAASPDSLDKFVLPKDPSELEGRIMVSIHAYTPYDFAIANIRDFNTSVKSSVNWVFTNLNNKLTKKNIPVYIGEWGVYAEKSNYDARLKYVAHYISSASSLKDASGNVIKIPTVIWDNASYGNEKENYALLNRKTNKWYEEEYVKAITAAGN